MCARVCACDSREKEREEKDGNFLNGNRKDNKKKKLLKR